MALGAMTTLGYGVETNWGTGTAIGRHVPIISEGLRRTQNSVYDMALRGSRSRFGADRKQGTVEIGGDVVTPGYIMGLEGMFLAAFGNVVTSAAVAGATLAKKHAFSLGDDLKSLTIEKKLGNQYFKYAGMMVSQLQCSAEVGQGLRFTWSFVGRDEAVSAAGAAPNFLPNNTYFYFKGASLTVAGSSITSPRVEWTLDNALKNRGPALGSLVTRGIKPGLRAVTGRIETDFDSITEYNRFIQGTPASLVLTYEDDTVIETVPGTPQTLVRPRLTVTFPQVFYIGETPTTSGPDEIPQSLPFEAYSDGIESEIKLELINSTVEVD